MATLSHSSYHQITPKPANSNLRERGLKMEFEDQEEEQEEEPELELPPSYGSLGNSSRPNMPSSPDAPPYAAAAASPWKPRYRECLKNHAVGLGGHAVDGCGEFMPAGPDGNLDALKCAACNCHRNFHRKETSAGATAGAGIHLLTYHHPPYFRTPSGYLHRRPLALTSTSGGGGSGGGGGWMSREEQEDMSNSMSSKKRFRTKFSQEQKDKMLGLAQSLDWKINKQDESVVEQFCSDTGVKRHVLKVWMHNNKHTLGKKP